ncbi:formyltetrahydrofolate deformylase [Tersicoccus phoenicis]|uniref:Formyltetrahydrofolate deformylase n=1 Tax=Tersicoccus phoenicis TaxID=554083 RepID=A0A1R1L6E8_9MICC|nr:formyltetrahydrofolate deformylase [Tersicoccus phoenicis]OMH23112.1 formyltetrahydrofolate deformylase [Tersicoccus phoenicis]
MEYVLTLDCPERLGIVHAVTGFLLEQQCDIVDSKQFDDRRDGYFCLRLEVAGPTGADPDADGGQAPGAELARLREGFEPIADRFGMTWKLVPKGSRTRVLIMVSKFGHCLNDLLYRTRNGELPIEIVAVVSNHEDHAGLVGWHSIPFFHVPVTAATKPAAEARLLDLVDRFDAELVVLARYMQVLSDDLSAALSGRCINIHHSFLPSFKGAKPYHQAWERGVKMVGATAHYVNAELDEGPIIAQQVIDVDHTHAPEDLVAVGRDAEVAALTRAVRWHAEGRVVLRGQRTVVLR